MKKFCYILLAGSLLSGCASREYSVVVENPDNAPRAQIVEVAMSDINNALSTDKVIVTDADGRELPSQITYDGQLLFFPEVAGNSAATFKIIPGEAAPADTLVCGRLYPERLDDMNWENDVVGFRAYGPGTQQAGDKLYGYDLYLKRNTDQPFIEGIIHTDHDPAVWAAMDSLRAVGKEAEADSILNAVSYHIDHGFGMDCYAVGPTLGAGVSAILENDSIVYPWCFNSYKILDNGPLRFTVELTFEPKVIAGDTITERRVISLDRGSNLNLTKVYYDGLTGPARAVAGIVIHKAENPVEISNGYLAYLDPTQGDDNGELYMGLIPVSPTDSTAMRTDNGITHAVVYSTLKPGEPLTYRWGFGWNRANMPSWGEWLNYLSQPNQPFNIEYRNH